MKLYILIFEQDTDSAWGAEASPFLKLDIAQKSMRDAFEKTLKLWEFDKSYQTDEHKFSCQDTKAVILDGTDVVSWRIETHEINIEMAVEVSGGLVQNIYANADISPDVYDLDVPDFPDENEEEEVESKREELERRKSQPDWAPVW